MQYLVTQSATNTCLDWELSSHWNTVVMSDQKLQLYWRIFYQCWLQQKKRIDPETSRLLLFRRILLRCPNYVYFLLNCLVLALVLFDHIWLEQITQMDQILEIPGTRSFSELWGLNLCAGNSADLRTIMCHPTRSQVQMIRFSVFGLKSSCLVLQIDSKSLVSLSLLYNLCWSIFSTQIHILLAGVVANGTIVFSAFSSELINLSM